MLCHHHTENGRPEAAKDTQRHHTFRSRPLYYQAEPPEFIWSPLSDRVYYTFDPKLAQSRGGQPR